LNFFLGSAHLRQSNIDRLEKYERGVSTMILISTTPTPKEVHGSEVLYSK
jgi:hypothetical protein